MSSHDFATLNANGKRGADGDGEQGRTRAGVKKRRVVRHKVVIHTSPFLRCLQTSTAISAGLAQFSPTIETGAARKGAVEGRSRSPNPLGMASPRLRAAEGGGASPRLGPTLSEPKHDLVHEVARRALQERKRYRRSKLRVDAFLGEWLNPQYFEDITPPPPSAMMVKTAKAELMQNETVEVFTPMATSSGKTSGSNSLWSGGAKPQSLDEWSHIQDSLPAPTAVRESRSRASTVGSDASSPVESSGRKSPFRPGSALSPLTSMLPKPDLSVYSPPTPQYAVSSSDQIPRGYVAHARNACADVDFQWDSSRAPQEWGDGGELGEEWSAMHRRLRRGLDCLVKWYARHGDDERGEDALGFEQAERRFEDGSGGVEAEEEEELVVVMVTHGAGCNALIGALTGQPVLLDVGMASLTMAVRKDDSPSVPIANGSSPAQSPGPGRRNSTDLGLSSIYDMKLVASTEHLRPGSNLSQSSSVRRGADLASVRDSLAQYKRNFGSGSSIDSQPFLEPAPRSSGTTSNTSALLGSIRRPSAAPLSAPGSAMPSRMNSSFPGRQDGVPSPPISQGLWTPPAGRTPVLRPQAVRIEEKGREFAALGAGGGGGEDTMVLDFSNSPPDSRPGSSGGKKRSDGEQANLASINGTLEAGSAKTREEPSGEKKDQLPIQPPPGDEMSGALKKGLSEAQNRLWGNGSESGSGNVPSGDVVERTSPTQPKRRWTVDDRE